MSEPGSVVAVLDPGGPGSGANPGLVSVARQLADGLGARAACVLAGPPDRGAAASAVALGADDVFTAVAPWLDARQPDAWVAALAETCRELESRVLLLSHNTLGREVAPRLAARLGAGLVSDCVSIHAGGDGLIAVRPCFSGKALSTWVAGGPGLTIATLRRQAVPPGASPARGEGVVTVLRLDDRGPGRTRVIERVVPPPGQVHLEDAGVVVSVGRGIGTREALQEYIVDGLAAVLGAPVGGSRGAVDLGIIPPDLQIGLTGRVVSPKLYIAVGLSGSPQHMAGCSGAQTIVAVNTDPQAPIFGFAQYGVVGDYRKVIPSLTSRLRQVLAAPAG
ncbi:MAG: electron transfer flavoprotein subunit alpha/FixB family protein [Chloroflexi bacterium]|nr:electron transfer flavoprotein subunit alpha/FixB family protein [Chloroflexota bacterium]